jgi:hypothetical protein
LLASNVLIYAVDRADPRKHRLAVKAEDFVAFGRRFSADKSPTSRSEDHAVDLYDETGMPA